MWPTFILLGFFGGFAVSSWRPAGVALLVLLVASSLAVLATGTVLTIPVAALNGLVGAAVGLSIRRLVELCTRLWNAS
jgi:hypothetical protein